MALNQITNQKGFKMHENALTQTFFCALTQRNHSSPETCHFDRYGVAGMSTYIYTDTHVSQKGSSGFVCLVF